MASEIMIVITEQRGVHGLLDDEQPDAGQHHDRARGTRTGSPRPRTSCPSRSAPGPGARASSGALPVRRGDGRGHDGGRLAGHVGRVQPGSAGQRRVVGTVLAHPGRLRRRWSP